MPESVYKVIELIGTSSDSWEKAAANAVEQCPLKKLRRRARNIVSRRRPIYWAPEIPQRATI